jgi:beta-lactamase class A
MRRISLFSFLLPFLPLAFTYLFSLTPWWHSSANPAIVASKVVPDTLHTENEEDRVPIYDLNTLPLVVSEQAIKTLDELKNQDLQAKLEGILHSNSRWVELSKNKNLSIGIVDMLDPLNARFAAINPNNMVYAASLPKIAVLLASQDAIEKGKFIETAEVKADMRLMIAKSNNAAATRMINRVGLEGISKTLQDPRYNLYDRENGGGLWVGKAYGGSNGRNGDPIKNLSHAASVFEVCKYYYMLAFGQMVNYERSKEMLSFLVDPELHHKFVSVLDRVAPNAKVYRKSGTWQTWHTDSALVWDKDRRYIVVVLAEDAQGETMLRELMLKIDSALTTKG